MGLCFNKVIYLKFFFFEYCYGNRNIKIDEINYLLNIIFNGIFFVINFFL